MLSTSGIGIFTAVLFFIVIITYIIIYNLHKKYSVSDDTCAFMKRICGILFLLLGFIFLVLDIVNRALENNLLSLYGVNIYTVLCIVSLTMGIVYNIDNNCSVLPPQK